MPEIQSAPSVGENQANGSDILGILGFKTQLPIQRGETGGDVVPFQANCNGNEREIVNLPEKSDLSHGVFSSHTRE